MVEVESAEADSPEGDDGGESGGAKVVALATLL